MDKQSLDWFRNDFLDPDTLDLLNKSIAGHSELDRQKEDKKKMHKLVPENDRKPIL